MTPFNFLLFLLFLLILVELIFQFSFRLLKKNCPWIITPSDLDPEIDSNGLSRFLEHGWDKELGWARKPNTCGNEVGLNGIPTKYHIDENGARHCPGTENLPIGALLFGDSYAFSRQVNDDETWAYLLSINLGQKVQNFGVGNYGIDQALMLYERKKNNFSAPVVIMAVVPETISRILSQWKHFSEYGNTFGFKPRFQLENNKLNFLDNPIQTPDDFYRIKDLLPELINKDWFYKNKFNKDLLRIPYVISIFKNKFHNLRLLFAAIIDKFSSNKSHAFAYIMKRNIKISSQLYQQPFAQDLLTAICKKFSESVRRDNSIPIIVYIPQMFDLYSSKNKPSYYAPIAKKLNTIAQFIDVTPTFLQDKSSIPLYINDKYGGHLTSYGNQLVADLIAKTLRPLLTNDKS